MKKSYRSCLTVLCISVLLTVLLFSGCNPRTANKGYQKNPALDTSQNIVLRLAISNETWPEMDSVIAKFEDIYPNCTILTEQVENYLDNITTRLNQTEQKIDIFRTANIQENTAYRDSALNLISDYSKKYLDLSGCNQGLVANFKYTAAENTQYAIPFGGEMRGMYVNLTLLQQYNLELPTNREELLNCCKVLHDDGLIPFQGSNGTFAQQLLYPYICNTIVNGPDHEKMYSDIAAINDGVSQYFLDAYSFLYEIVEKGYYDYKRVEELYGYGFKGSEDKARNFLNILPVSDDIYEKADDIGKIAFIVDTQAFEAYIKTVKSDYDSKIEYQFIASPVGPDGGYAYLSPSDGLAINKSSDHTDWALEFLDFFFTPEISTDFAHQTGKIPNTADALLQFDIPAERTSDVGQVTFDYTFYKTVTTLMMGGYSGYTEANANYRSARPEEEYYYKSDTDDSEYLEATAEYIAENPDAKLYRLMDDMIGISKMNAEKYMNKNDDGTYSIKFTLDDYMKRLEAEFQNVKISR